MGQSAIQRGSLEHGTSVLTAAGQKQRMVLSAFVELLRDGDRDIRLAAAESLGRVGDQRAASALMTALSDGDEAVRRAAARSLEFLHFLGAA
jgi:HEAT repeat protein